MNARNLKVVFVALVLCTFTAAAFAAEAPGLKAKIPFDFMVNGQSYPAGEYVVNVRGAIGRGVAMLSGPDGNFLTLVNAITWDGPTRQGTPYLTFHGYENRYFLRNMWTGTWGVGLEFPRSREEKEILNALRSKAPSQLAQVKMVAVAGH